MQATKVEIEDHQGGLSSSGVEIEGYIVALDPAGMTFQLQIQEIEKGASLALPVLAGLPSAQVITVSYGPATPTFFDSVVPTTTDFLAVGQEVDVDFQSFQVPPFPAAKIEIEDDDPNGNVEFEGFISGTAGLPASFEMQLKSGEAAILAGQVAPGAPVTVTLGTAPLFLDTEGKPSLAPAQLLTGLKVEVTGAISGSPTAAQIAAAKVKVRAGRLKEAIVTAVFPADGSFHLLGGELKDPFGSSVTAGPFTVEIAPSAVFDDDVSSAAELFAAFQGLSGGEVLEVELEGIGTGLPGEILAYEIEAEVEDDD